MMVLALNLALIGSGRFSGKPVTSKLDKPIIRYVFEGILKSFLLTISTTPVESCNKENSEVVYFYGSEINTFTTGSIIKVSGGE